MASVLIDTYAHIAMGFHAQYVVCSWSSSSSAPYFCHTSACISKSTRLSTERLHVARQPRLCTRRECLNSVASQPQAKPRAHHETNLFQSVTVCPNHRHVPLPASLHRVIAIAGLSFIPRTPADFGSKVPEYADHVSLEASKALWQYRGSSSRRG